MNIGLVGKLLRRRPVNLFPNSFISLKLVCFVNKTRRAPFFPFMEKYDDIYDIIGRKECTMVITKPSNNSVLFLCGSTDSGKLCLPENKGNKGKIQDALHRVQINQRIKTVVASSDHTFMITEEGVVLVCGSLNNSGVELEHAHWKLNGYIEKIAEITSLKPYKIIDLSSLNGHTLALDSLGRVFSWGNYIFWVSSDNVGSGGFGRLGHGDSQPCKQPKRIESLKDVKSIFVGDSLSYFVTSMLV